ncbi:general secretion pathway protein H [Thiohalospira halophila DSM 15071]|uniref:Type II secretion system protein H n=1 Tax=Thiohalospira halophila DSM 15071 TaxID=1123397 RepID=A0A1I1N9Z1_9GAMM|nr:type II secretion system minor pseudopilin GspH [Thiohalospira halophila]SFC94449.1 general secretion pathway protein H [Thiohalospira halophila DSM 15071]
MPTSATGTWRTSGGFTLIELLVVMAIMGIVLGMSTLSIDLAGADRHAREEAQRLVVLGRLARQEAILDSASRRLLPAEDGYRFEARGPGRWNALEGPFRPRELPGGLRLELARLDQGLSGTSAEREADREEAGPTAIHFLASGEVTPFELRLVSAEGEPLRRITGDRAGRLEHGAIQAEAAAW